MSASDAAPLPRLGEVFFDVRGSSRSMRLSWYADTGVAVFSIWQGGMCTGTFRLPIGDLPRMVDTLQRGPGGQPSGQDPGRGQAFSDDPLDPTVRVPGLAPRPGEERPDHEPGMSGYGTGTADYQTGTADYQTGTADYQAGTADYQAGTADYRPGVPADYPAHPSDRWTGPADYLSDPAGRPAESPGQPTEYLPDLPGADREASRGRNGQSATASHAGYRDGALDLGPRSGSRYPDALSDAGYPERPREAWDPGGRPEAPYPGPGRSEASYPGGRAEGSYPGPSDGSYLAAGPEAWNPGRSDVAYPGARADRPRSPGGSSPGGRADDPYLGGTSPMDFPAEPAPPHYAPGMSAPEHDEVPGRSAADYPAHYRTAVTDDVAQSPPPESFPYGPPPGNRGPAGRHADPEAPFD